MAMKTITKLWILVFILAILSPIGLILPERYRAGVAWGEWGIEEIRKLLGYVPDGLSRLASVWNAPMPDYTLKIWNEKLAYIVSAAAGIMIIAAIVFIIGRFIRKGGKGLIPRGRRKGDIFIERSMKAALDFFKEAVFAEEIARSGGLLQSIDTRLKIPLLIILLALSIFANTIPLLLILYLSSVGLAAASGIRVVYFLKRVWFFIPVFTLFIAIPAFFIQGPYYAVLFILRVTSCVSFVIVFAITTPHNKLFKSFRNIGVPSVFIQVLDMMYRYLFLFIKVFEEMHMALKSRLLENFHGRQARYWIASRIAFLFKRSMRMSEDVYMAMIARGYGIEDKK